MSPVREPTLRDEKANPSAGLGGRIGRNVDPLSAAVWLARPRPYS
jgi:hypothetical protein